MTESAKPAVMRVIFSKRRSMGLVFGLSVPQLVLMGAALGCVVMAVQAGGAAWWRWLLVVLAGLLVGATFARHYGRLFAAYVPSLLGEAIMRPFGAHVFRGGPARTVTAGPNPEPGSQLPGPLSQLRIESYDVGAAEMVGMVRDTSDGTIAGVLQVSGDTFSMLAAEEKNRRVQGLQRWLDSMAIPDSPVVAVQLLTAVLPDDGDEVNREWRLRQAAQIDAAELAESPDGASFASDIYDALLRSDERGAWTHESYVVLRVDPQANRAVKSEVRAQGGAELGGLALLWKWMNEASSQLQDAGVRVAGWLPDRGVAAIIRRAFDPASAPMIARRGGGSGDSAGGDGGLPSGVAVEMAGPTRAERAMSYYAHDGHLSRSWWFTEYPRAKDGREVGLLQPVLLEAPCWHTVSVTLTPLAGNKAQRQIDVQASTQDAKKSMDEKAKRRRRRRDEREEADTDRRESELVEGYSSWNVWGLITCTAPDEVSLVDAGSKIASATNRCSIEAQIWYVETDQAFFCGALPLARIPG